LFENTKDGEYEKYLTGLVDQVYANNLKKLSKLLFLLSILIFVVSMVFNLVSITDIKFFQRYMIESTFFLCFSVTALLSISKFREKYEILIKRLFFLTLILFIIFFLFIIFINPSFILRISNIIYALCLSSFLVLLYLTIKQKYVKESQILSFILLVTGIIGFFFYLQPGMHNHNLAFRALVTYFILGFAFLLIHPDKGLMRIFCLNNLSSRFGRYFLSIFSVIMFSILLFISPIVNHTNYLMHKDFPFEGLITFILLFVFYLLIFAFVRNINKKDINSIILKMKSDKREKFFERLIDYTNDMVLVTDSNHIITYANSKLFEILKLDKDTFLGKNFMDVSPELFIKKDLYLKSCKNLTTEFIESHKVTVQGKDLYLSGYAVPILKDGNFNGSINVIVNVTDIEKDESNLKSSLKLLNVLLTEVHHRVKNNMQIIISLLNLQKYQIKDENVINVLNDSQSRIKAISLVHENLYMSGQFSEINIKDYIDLLIGEVKNHYSNIPNLTINNNVEDKFISLDNAVPLGLIINELLNNSIIDGFNNGEYLKEKNIQGVIDVNLFQNDNYEAILKVKDNGRGFNLSNKDLNISIELMNALSSQLSAEYEIVENNGVEFIFIMPQI